LAYVKPGINMKFWGTDWANASLYLQLYAKLNAQAVPYVPCELKAGVKGGAEANLKLFKKDFAKVSYPDIFDFSKVLFSCSEEIDKFEIVSGNSQTGSENATLSNPLKVIAKDKDGDGVPGARVTFRVSSGGGSVSQQEALTDENGYAETAWTLGKKSAGEQKVEVYVYKKDSTKFNTLPLVFNAAVIVEANTITDPRDGQVYKIVKIGNQTWFAENLRYAGSIPNVADSSTWANTTNAAWCYYDNNSSLNPIYGKLYNWYAVNNSQICPLGWHIPSLIEWNEMINFLGGNLVAGGKLKTLTGWNSPNINATNESGFNGLPGGRNGIMASAGFSGLGEDGYWWINNETDISGAKYLTLSNIDTEAFIGNSYKQTGQSCRCIKD
jgi:uncharacterized protein (TIGR02145 family)